MSNDCHIIPLDDEQNQEGTPDLPQLRRVARLCLKLINIFMGQKIKSMLPEFT